MKNSTTGDEECPFLDFSIVSTTHTVTIPKEIVNLESLGGIMEVAIGDPPPFYTRVEMNVLQRSMSAVLERSPGASHYQILKGPTLQSLQTE